MKIVKVQEDFVQSLATVIQIEDEMVAIDLSTNYDNHLISRFSGANKLKRRDKNNQPFNPWNR